MKKILYSLIAVFVGASALNLVFSKASLAAGCDSTFFGIPSWCRGLGEGDGVKPIGKDGISIQQFIWTVVGNISDGIFRIIGVIAMGFIIWAGFQYMIAAGDSGKVAKAKATLTNAIIGLIIAVGASMIVQLIMGVF
ncbi:MAG: pilin [bacterium]|nr:pilin [bacterium]